ncbi:hypothetical protein GOB93_07715 [Acetobacter musti]|uniref:Uncharacterized protein n=1 Tax=Acetobacter musti TaxID=864732 RepID=A0ABX0JRE8_9PROT|nr:hypothetical protein [Acetobacter musti]NHN84530.1 hypothetical protein [Acetobacter musti]
MTTAAGPVQLDVMSASHNISEDTVRDIAIRALQCSHASVRDNRGPLVAHLFLSHSGNTFRTRHTIVLELHRGDVKLARSWKVIRLSSVDNSRILRNAIQQMASEAWRQAKLPTDTGCKPIPPDNEPEQP